MSVEGGELRPLNTTEGSVSDQPTDAGSNVHSEKIKISKFRSFLKEKARGNICPVCKHDDFAVIVDVDNLHVEQIEIKSRGGGYIPSIGTICDNCGFVATFYWATVRDWATEDLSDAE